MSDFYALNPGYTDWLAQQSYSAPPPAAEIPFVSPDIIVETKPASTIPVYEIDRSVNTWFPASGEVTSGILSGGNIVSVDFNKVNFTNLNKLPGSDVKEVLAAVQPTPPSFLQNFWASLFGTTPSVAKAVAQNTPSGQVMTSGFGNMDPMMLLLLIMMMED